MNKLKALVALSAALLAVTTARATTVIPPTFDELVQRAEIIFQGTVKDVRSQWIGEGAERRIVSFVTFTVDDALKGNPGAEYTIRMLGGTVGDETMEVTDAPKFKVGERQILFVENNGNQFVPLVGIQYGRFHVKRDEKSGRDMVITSQGLPLTDLSALGKQTDHADTAAPVPTAEAMSASDLKAAIQAKLASTH